MDDDDDDEEAAYVPQASEEHMYNHLAGRRPIVLFLQKHSPLYRLACLDLRHHDVTVRFSNASVGTSPPEWLSRGDGVWDLKGTLRWKQDDASRDFVCTGNGKTFVFNLDASGTVYFYHERMREGRHVIACDTYRENAPSWMRLYYAEARAAALTFLLVQRTRSSALSVFPVDIVRVIAKMVYASADDSDWEAAFDAYEMSYLSPPLKF